MANIGNNTIGLNNIVFSDEATFMLNGNVNQHNCRYWSNINPHWMKKQHTQHPEKFNEWLGIIGEKCRQQHPSRVAIVRTAILESLGFRLSWHALILLNS
ncbi:hypothetical protein J6590_053805 [Homalodisca vitripennis]|nr:hypothetical protein J6590_053805 [Homalodisca vitripennis]